MITSKLTSKAQTRIPQAVRAALRQTEGDELAYQIEGGRVILTKASNRGGEDPFGTFLGVGWHHRPKCLWQSLSRGTSFRVPFSNTDWPGPRAAIGRVKHDAPFGRSRGKIGAAKHPLANLVPSCIGVN